MRRFTVTGMSCAACQSRVENAVRKLKGVDTCSVSLLTNSMTVSGLASDAEIILAVKNAGYSAFKNNDNNFFKNTEKTSKKSLNKLIVSAVLLIILMYFSMGITMFNLPLPDFLAKSPVIISVIQMFFCLAIMVVNNNFFINGIKGAIKLSPNMDTLVALGSGASFIYSTAVLIKIFISASLENKMALLHNLYFESAAMILVLVSVGKFLESNSKKKTTNSLKELICMKPKTATVIRNGNQMLINVTEVKKGDIFVVKPGETIAVDGRVVKGTGSVDEAFLTGESIPVDKTIGSLVYEGCANLNGYLECEAVNVGEDSTLSKIIQTVSNTEASKAPIARVADKVASVFVPTVILIALITFIVWLLADKSIAFSLSRAVSVLVISCPCALGLATPVAITVGNGLAAKRNILFKSASALENCGRIKTVVLDKTGTVTKGKPVVTDIITFNISENELLTLAYSVEKLSEHPLALAITQFCENKNVNCLNVEDFTQNVGNGLSATINGKPFIAGKFSFANLYCEISQDVLKTNNELSSYGKTVLYFVYNKVLIGIIAVADTLKDDSKKAIFNLKNSHYNVVMLTGDNDVTAKAIANLAGIDTVYSQVLPDEKAETVNSLVKVGKTAMVGDGINDAPALTAADLGIAIGAGADIAIDCADVVIMKNNLSDVFFALKLGRFTLKIIKQNLFWAFLYNILCIPLAAGVFVPFFDLSLNPMLAAAAMSLSSFCVVTNALRINLFKIKEKNLRKGDNDMQITLNVEGMMCPHCEMHVKNALEALEEVNSAIADHKSCKVVISLNADINENILIDVIEKQGYKVIL